MRLSLYFSEIKVNQLVKFNSLVKLKWPYLDRQDIWEDEPLGCTFKVTTEVIDVVGKGKKIYLKCLKDCGRHHQQIQSMEPQFYYEVSHQLGDSLLEVSYLNTKSSLFIKDQYNFEEDLPWISRLVREGKLPRSLAKKS